MNDKMMVESIFTECQKVKRVLIDLTTIISPL